MKIIELINVKFEKIHNSDNNNKARILLQSVNIEIQENTNFNIPKALNGTVSMVNLMNQSEYLLELMVTRHLLEYYRDNNTFDMIVKPYPDTPRDNKRFNTIKDHLVTIFKGGK